MIHSMTGFGKAITELPNRKITVEIKSLNSKQLDLSTRIPAIYREKEMEIRSEIAKRLERGKVDFSIFIENIGRDACTQLNMPVIEGYYQQIKEASETLKIALPSDWFQTLLRSSRIDENRYNGIRRQRRRCIDADNRQGNRTIGRVQATRRSNAPKTVYPKDRQYRIPSQRG